MLFLSASGLPRADRCPGSATLPRYQSWRESAQRGRVLHAEKEAEQPEGAEVAFALNVKTGEARELGKRLDRKYPKLVEGEIVGTTDRITVEPARVVIRDYKSGFGFHVAPPAENLQLLFYAVAGARVHGKDSARVEIEYLDQDGRVDAADLDALDLAAAFGRIRAVWEAANVDPAVVTGDHCAMCPCIRRCPAQTQLALAVGTGDAAKVLPTLELTPASVAVGWQKLQAFKKLAGEVERVYRAYAAAEPIPLGNGRFLGPVNKKREELDGAIAANVLREKHGPAVAAQACEVSTSKAAIERALATVAAKGKKAGMVRGVLDEIAAAGGIRAKWTTTVEEYDGQETST